MRTFAKFLFHLYLTIVIIFIFVPLGVFLRIIHQIKRSIIPNPNSYFDNVRYKENVTTAIRSYNYLNRIILHIVKPCLWLGQFFRTSLFSQIHPRFKATPNQVAAICLSQFVRNAKAISSTAQQNNAKYIFSLQPSLLYAGPSTKDDKIFYESKNKQRIWGFPFKDFVEAYYSNLIQTFSKDPQLKDQFFDLSDLFVNCKEQRFVDTVHMGNKAQEECAQQLSEIIIKTCEKDQR